jgi:hypothetical protein
MRFSDGDASGLRAAVRVRTYSEAPQAESGPLQMRSDAAGRPNWAMRGLRRLVGHWTRSSLPDYPWVSIHITRIYIYRYRVSGTMPISASVRVCLSGSVHPMRKRDLG